MKESLISSGETGHDCYEKKAKIVMMKLVMIVMKRQFKNSNGEAGHDCYEKKV